MQIIVQKLALLQRKKKRLFGKYDEHNRCDGAVLQGMLAGVMVLREPDKHGLRERGHRDRAVDTREELCEGEEEHKFG